MCRGSRREGAKVVTLAVHRIVEQQAAARGDIAAIVDPGGATTYRDLNHRANSVARHLISHGFRRGAHAVVAMDRSRDLAVVLLAILKAGGCYSLLHPAGARAPWRVAIAPELSSALEAYLPIELAPPLADAAHSGPNLPIIARASDPACVLRDDGGQPAVLVPHSTITALQSATLPRPCYWSSQTSALDLWIGLMAGATVRVDRAEVLDGIAA